MSGQKGRLFVCEVPVIVRCLQCNNILGEILAGYWVIRYRRREWIGREIIAVRCERCGQVWLPENNRNGKADEKTASLA